MNPLQKETEGLNYSTSTKRSICFTFGTSFCMIMSDFVKEGIYLIIDYEAMGRRIRRKRQEKGLTQLELAKKINLSPSYYGHIERGTRTPSLETLVLIANELMIGTDVILRDSLKIPVPVERNPLFSQRDLHLLREYLQVQQDALDNWLDDDEAEACNE